MNKNLNSFMQNIEGAMMVIQSNINRHVTKDGSIRYVFDTEMQLCLSWNLFEYFSYMEGPNILGMEEHHVNEVYIIEVYAKEEDK